MTADGAGNQTTELRIALRLHFDLWISFQGLS